MSGKLDLPVQYAPIRQKECIPAVTFNEFGCRFIHPIPKQDYGITVSVYTLRVFCLFGVTVGTYSPHILFSTYDNYAAYCCSRLLCVQEICTGHARHTIKSNYTSAGIIISTPSDPRLKENVASAVSKAAVDSGVSRMM